MSDRKVGVKVDVNSTYRFKKSQALLAQSSKNSACGNFEIPLVVIRLGVTGLRNTGFIYLLDVFGGR